MPVHKLVFIFKEHLSFFRLSASQIDISGNHLFSFVSLFIFIIVYKTDMSRLIRVNKTGTETPKSQIYQHCQFCAITEKLDFLVIQNLPRNN